MRPSSAMIWAMCPWIAHLSGLNRSEEKFLWNVRAGLFCISCFFKYNGFRAITCYVFQSITFVCGDSLFWPPFDALISCIVFWEYVSRIWRWFANISEDAPSGNFFENISGDTPSGNFSSSFFQRTKATSVQRLLCITYGGRRFIKLFSAANNQVRCQSLVYIHSCRTHCLAHWYFWNPLYKHSAGARHGPAYL